MRHLLGELHKELEKPTNTPSSQTETDPLDNIFSHLEFGWKRVKTKEDTDPLTHKALINNWDLSHYDDPLLVSTPLSSPVRITPLTKIVGEEPKNDGNKRGFDSASLRDEFLNNQGDSQEGFHQRDAAATNDENYESSNIISGLNQGDGNLKGEIKELEDLGSNLSEMLHVSRSTQSVGTANEPDANSVASGSDDDF